MKCCRGKSGSRFCGCYAAQSEKVTCYGHDDIRAEGGDAPSEEVLARVWDAAHYPVTFDKDCPELTDEELREFRPVDPELHRNTEFFRPEKSNKAEV